MRAHLHTTALSAALAAALGLLAGPAWADDKIEMQHGDGQASVERRLEPTAPAVKGDRVRTAQEEGQAAEGAAQQGQTQQKQTQQGQSEQGQSQQGTAAQGQQGGPAPAGDGKGAGSGQEGDVSAATVQDVKDRASDRSGEAGGGKEKEAQKGSGDGGKERAEKEPSEEKPSDEGGMSEQARESVEDHAQGYFARMKDRGVPVETY